MLEDIGILGLLSIGVSLLLVILSRLLGNKSRSKESLSSYECGFESLESSRERQDISFYLIGILFIIFDIESCYIYGWAVELDRLGSESMLCMLEFLLELVVGLCILYRERVF